MKVGPGSWCGSPRTCAVGGLLMNCSAANELRTSDHASPVLGGDHKETKLHSLRLENF